MPEDVGALLQAGMQHHREGRVAEAESFYRRVLALEPDHVAALVNLGVAVADRPHEAAEILARAVKLAPGLSQAHNNLGNAYRRLERLDEAAAAYRRAADRAPGDPEVRSNLGAVARDAGRIDEAISCYRAALSLRPDLSLVHSNLIYARLFDGATDERALLEECRRWSARFAAPLTPATAARAPDPDPERRLRIGYVGNGFFDHCQALFLVPTFEQRDRERFEVHVFSGALRDDGIRDRLRLATDGWHDVQGMSDEALAALVTRERIDILVDLTMHMAGGRLGVFARRPAPVQVTWLAYPGTTGLDTIDYRLTDPSLDPLEPPGQSDAAYSERSVRLPSTFWCYDPLSDVAESELPARRNGGVTFGCLNHFCKVSAASLRLWASVLRAVAGSTLLLLAPTGAPRARVIETLGREGIDASRIHFIGRQARRDYLEVFHRIDVCLDTLPYNGHTTSLDALWMGVPVVTRVGATVVGRAGLSQLANLGLSDLVATSDRQFVEIACTLAGDLDRLETMRRSLRERMRRSPLMDAAAFARGLESAYRIMWRRYCAGAR
jgi:protein O-GlcNAc transferase